jgi:hypothetical protein
MSLHCLDLEAFQATPLSEEPFRDLVVPGFVHADACACINADYPRIGENGSFPVAQLSWTLPAFQRADNSWHGHKPFVGPRRVIHFNWVTSEGNRRLAMLRHQVSAAIKRLFGALRAAQG